MTSAADSTIDVTADPRIANYIDSIVRDTVPFSDVTPEYLQHFYNLYMKIKGDALIDWVFGEDKLWHPTTVRRFCFYQYDFFFEGDALCMINDLLVSQAIRLIVASVRVAGAEPMSIYHVEEALIKIYPAEYICLDDLMNDTDLNIHTLSIVFTLVEYVCDKCRSNPPSRKLSLAIANMISDLYIRIRKAAKQVISRSVETCNSPLVIIQGIHSSELLHELFAAVVPYNRITP